MSFNLRFIPVLVLMPCMYACNNDIKPETDQLETSMENSNSIESQGSGNQQNTPQYAEGKDYFLFNRVKIMDLQAFSQPAEAYSILLPKDWQSEGGVIWTAPGQTCAGTNLNFSAQSRNGEFNFQILPNTIWSYNTDP